MIRVWEYCFSIKAVKVYMNFRLVVVLSTLFLVQCLVNFRILKKTYADTVATGILVVVEEFFGLKLGNSTIEVEVCWEFFSVSVDTVPHIHIRKQWKINLIMMFCSPILETLSVYTINTLASKHCIFSITKKIMPPI